MIWKIVYDAKAKRDLRKLPSSDHSRIVERIERLTGSWDGLDVKRLKGRDGQMRLRVGNYRVMFETAAETQTISITRVQRRSERTYRVLAWLALWGIG